MGAIIHQILWYQRFGSDTSPHRGDTCTRGKNKNNRFFIYGPHCKKKYIYIVIFVGPWCALNSYTGPIWLPRYYFIHINIRAKHTI